jgi:hypothetical protein
MHSTEGSRDPAPLDARAGFSFNHPFSPMAHRSGRVIDTDALLRIFLVLHVMAKSASRVPRIIQSKIHFRASLARLVELFDECRERRSDGRREQVILVP